MCFEHRDALDRERRRLHHERQQARRAASLASGEHRHALAQARSIARAYRGVWAQAKRDGRRLLELYDRHVKARAA
jgi:hypothetical protein